MQQWDSGARGRRRAVLALALFAHAVLVGTMLRARVSRERATEGRAVEATILLSRTPPPRAAIEPSPPPRPTRLRAIPHVDADPRTIRAPALEAPTIALAASAAEPPASAASQSLNLTLTREQLRAVIAAGRPTLAQSLAQGPKPSALARLDGEATDDEVQMAGGVTEVHVHGACFRLVPTPRAQYDPFNHGNERLTAGCK